MAETNTGPQKSTFHLANNIFVLIVVIVAIIAFAGGWFAGQHHSSKPAAKESNQTSDNMASYTNPKYGFGLKYPQSWGQPNFSTSKVSGSQSYSLQFFKKDPSAKLQYYIFLSMISDNAKALTGSSVLQQIKNNKSALTVYDDSSYALIGNAANQKTSSLSAYQVVDLKKINVTAASLTYQITGGAGNCPQNQFAQNSSGGCIERSDYNTVNTVLKSIKSL